MASGPARPAVNEPVNVSDYARLARACLPGPVWDYLAAGAGAEFTTRANSAALRRLALRPRVLVDVSERATTTTILNRPIAAPIMIAPVAYHNLVHPAGEVATAEAAGAEGVPLVVSTFAGRSLEEITRVATGPLWLQLYLLRDRALLKDLVQRAEQAGCQALVLTVDMPVMGRRDRDIRNGFALPDDVVPANFIGAPPAGTATTLVELAHQLMDPALNWDAVDWLRSTSGLPVILKGILTAEDARLARSVGVAGIVVSNHGGRQVDGAIASIDALPEVVDVAGDMLEVYVDGGFRSGPDILKALALGARAVLIGRPALWGLAADGAAGVRRVLRLLKLELELTMGNCGCPTIEHIGPALVRHVSDPTGERG